MKNPIKFPLVALTAGLCFGPVVSHAAMDLQSWSSSPWNLTSGATSFSGTVTDPLYGGGTNATFSFSTPLVNVDTSDPADPDASAATASIFGVEGTGFGVGESGVGRFDRNESFVFEANHSFQINGIRFAEYQGDESIHIRWISGGVEMSQYFDLPTGSFYTTVGFSDIEIDPNTPVVITNVSDSLAGANGRIRINQILVKLIDPILPPGVGDTHRLQSWTNSPWNAVGGTTSFSGDINDPDAGIVEFSFLDPVSGVDVTDPDNPDFSSVSVSTFGIEGTGFGVGSTSLGRFERGESFVIQAEHDFQLQTIRWAEYSGDESLHLAWTTGGVSMSTKIDVGPGSFYTEIPFVSVHPDANTPLTITNVSSTSAHASGRLRVNHIDVALLIEQEPEEPNLFGAALILGWWELWPWNLTGGDYDLSGTLTFPENGGIPVTFEFTAQKTVDVDDPENPDFTNATITYFGVEGTGLGVGETTVGRFDRGESMTITADHDYLLEQIVWREHDGDELLHATWTSGGSPHEEVFSLTEARTSFDNLIIDANTELTITNVSLEGSPLNGRLRLGDIKVRLAFENEPYYDHSGPDGFVQMTGVNLAGAEFGGFTFWQTDPAQWDYYNSKGLNLIRVPFKWQRIQSSLYGSVDFTNLDIIMDLAEERGMKVILDMHDYSKYNGNTIGTTAVPYAAFKDVWKKIATQYEGHPALYGYGLMNEPTSTNNHWPTAAQDATDSIREVDSTGWILVGGISHSGAQSWRNSTTNNNLNVYDPEDKIIYEAHSYFDDSWPSYDGDYGSFDSEKPVADRGTRLVMPFILWLQEHGHRGFIGEFGTPKNDVRWNPILDDFMDTIVRHGLSSTYWAGGKNWSNYELDISPTNNYTVDAIQMEVLEKYGD